MFGKMSTPIPTLSESTVDPGVESDDPADGEVELEDEDLQAAFSQLLDKKTDAADTVESAAAAADEEKGDKGSVKKTSVAVLKTLSKDEQVGFIKDVIQVVSRPFVHFSWMFIDDKVINRLRPWVISSISPMVQICIDCAIIIGQIAEGHVKIAKDIEKKRVRGEAGSVVLDPK